MPLMVSFTDVYREFRGQYADHEAHTGVRLLDPSDCTYFQSRVSKLYWHTSMAHPVSDENES